VIYLDSCALVKLVLPEPETPALEAFLHAQGEDKHVTAALARTEIVRAVRRSGAHARFLDVAADLLRRLTRVQVTEELLDRAGRLPDRQLRSLDAVHLAAALTLGDALTVLVTYDQRLTRAARDQDLPLAAPS